MEIKCAFTELVELHKIQPNPKNPNKHGERQIEMLAKIIDYQGQRSPIVVSKRSGYLVKGHGRLEAIKKLGWQKVAVDWQEYESEAQEFADMIADNKIAELAEHDDAFMIEGIKELNLESMDFELLGLDTVKIDMDMPMPDLDSGDKAPFQQMTFTLHDSQAEQVKIAMDKAKSMGSFDSENENSNGNALARICEIFLTQNA